MPEIEGFILAGGASSRMGEDKARLRLGGETLVGHAAAALTSVARSVCLVSSRHRLEDFGLPVIADIFTGSGPLAGIHAALQNCASPWALVLSCDMPFVTGELLARLASSAGEGVDAVVPLQPDGRPQPLCALYQRATCLAAAEALLRAGERRPRSLLSRVRARMVPFQSFADLPRSELFFKNVNTPVDYDVALKEF